MNDVNSIFTWKFHEIEILTVFRDLPTRCENTAQRGYHSTNSAIFYTARARMVWTTTCYEIIVTRWQLLSTCVLLRTNAGRIQLLMLLLYPRSHFLFSSYDDVSSTTNFASGRVRWPSAWVLLRAESKGGARGARVSGCKSASQGDHYVFYNRWLTFGRALFNLSIMTIQQYTNLQYLFLLIFIIQVTKLKKKKNMKSFRMKIHHQK
jgi:hypothetical protein